MKAYNQSFYLILLQIAGIIVGFISTFYVAGKLDPAMFALIGVYNVICTLSMVFSSTGIETYGIRNILKLKKNNSTLEIEKIVTMSIIGRLITSIIILIPLFIYSLFISKYKFSENYFDLFLLMSLLSVFRSLNDSSNLLLKAFNKYLLSAISVYSVNIFGKLLAIFMFIKYGFIFYLYTLFLLPLVINFFSFYHIKNYINLKLIFDYKSLVNYLKESKNLLFANYTSFAFNNLDQLLVSIFLKPENLGVFTLAKNIWLMSKSFIENIFDPITQKVVSIKNNKTKLILSYNNINKVRNMILGISFLIFPLILIYLSDLIKLLNLVHYNNLDLFIITIYISSVIYVFAKVKLNFATLLFKSSYYLKIYIVNAMLSLIFFTVFIYLKFPYIFLYIGFSYLFLYLYLATIFKKNNFNNHL